MLGSAYSTAGSAVNAAAASSTVMPGGSASRSRSPRVDEARTRRLRRACPPPRPPRCLPSTASFCRSATPVLYWIMSCRGGGGMPEEGCSERRWHARGRKGRHGTAARQRGYLLQLHRRQEGSSPVHQKNCSCSAWILAAAPQTHLARLKVGRLALLLELASGSSRAGGGQQDGGRREQHQGRAAPAHASCAIRGPAGGLSGQGGMPRLGGEGG